MPGERAPNGPSLLCSRWAHHPDSEAADHVDHVDEEDAEQLGTFSLLKCSKGSVAILYLGMFCQFVNRALNFPAL